MNSDIVITSDSTTDLSPELKERYGIEICPLGVTLGGKTYIDGVDITPDDIYAHHDKTGELPKTSATNVGECLDFFRKFTESGKTRNSLYHKLGNVLYLCQRLPCSRGA